MKLFVRGMGLLLLCWLAACQTIAPAPTLQPTQTATKIASPTIASTLTPTMTATIKPTSTDLALTDPLEQEKATLSAFGQNCEEPGSDASSELSPNGQWIATTCRGLPEKLGSFLQVTSIDKQKSWQIHYADYAKGTYYDTDDMIYPYRWTRDGRYLYAHAKSRGSGCCWIGWDTVLLQLDLETGKQIEIANHVQGTFSFSISADDRHVLFILQDYKNLLQIWDAQTGKTKKIQLKVTNAGAGHIQMSPDNAKVVLVLRSYVNAELYGDLTSAKLVLVDLKSGQQKTLVTYDEYHDIVDLSWKDDTHILLQDSNQYWLLDINTGEKTEAEKSEADQ